MAYFWAPLPSLAASPYAANAGRDSTVLGRIDGPSGKTEWPCRADPSPLCAAKCYATRMALLTHCVNPLIPNSRYYRPMTDSISRLHVAIRAARTADPATSRTARLLQGGRSKVAKKLGEEAVEVVIDAMAGSRENVVRESADLLYNLVALWSVLEVDPKEVWSEMDRRERLFGIAEKLPKTSGAKARRKVTPFPIRRAGKRI